MKILENVDPPPHMSGVKYFLVELVELVLFIKVRNPPWPMQGRREGDWSAKRCEHN